MSFVSLAVCHAGGSVHCGLTVVPPGGAAQTIGATDDIPVRADWLQNRHQEGPAIGAARGGVVTSPDLADDQRWPDFGRMCVAALDVRSLLAVEAPLKGRGRALLTFYCDPEDLAELDLEAAVRLAPIAGSSAQAALDRGRTGVRSVPDVDYSQTAVALAIVMSHQSLTASQAYSRLRDAARRSGRPLVDVVQEVVATGHLPGDIAADSSSPRAGRHAFAGGPDMWSAHSGPAA